MSIKRLTDDEWASYEIGVAIRKQLDAEPSLLVRRLGAPFPESDQFQTSNFVRLCPSWAQCCASVVYLLSICLSAAKR
jgi:hypothetical protein